ncbi:MAG: hypothetical protein ILO42_08760 [Clostridia bacterium]|nr:hypothetical protein [Clostridia bacterium]
MLGGKYTKDYRLENTVDEKGRQVTTAVYVGRYYVFSASGDEVRRGRIAILLSAAAAAVFMLCGLLFYDNRGFASQYYTIVPFFVCVFPLMYLFFGVNSAFAFTGGYTREKKDHTGDRIAKCSFLGMLFSGAALAGIAVSAVLKLTGIEERPLTLNSVFFIASAVLTFVSFIVAFSNRKSVAMEERKDAPAGD